MLTYGFNEDEKAVINSVILQNSLPNNRVIEETMGKMKIRDIIDGLKFDIYDISLPQEKVILFNNFSDEELDSAIKNIRKHPELKSILAVVTETSIDWEFSYLMEHLIEEREWYKKSQNVKP